MTTKFRTEKTTARSGTSSASSGGLNRTTTSLRGESGINMGLNPVIKRRGTSIMNPEHAKVNQLFMKKKGLDLFAPEEIGEETSSLSKESEQNDSVDQLKSIGKVQ